MEELFTELEQLDEETDDQLIETINHSLVEQFILTGILEIFKTQPDLYDRTIKNWKSHVDALLATEIECAPDEERREEIKSLRPIYDDQINDLESFFSSSIRPN